MTTSAPQSSTIPGAPVVASRAAAETQPAAAVSSTGPTGNSGAHPQSLPTIATSPGVVVEKHYRSFVKAVSWRATGTFDTIIISFLITGKVKLAVSIGFVEVFTKIGLFYLHERLWNKIPLGRAKAQEDYTI